MAKQKLITSSEIDGICGLAGMPEAAHAIDEMQSRKPGKMISEAEVVTKLMVQMEVDVENFGSPGFKDIVGRLKTLCKRRNPDGFFRDYKAEKDSSWITSSQEESTPVDGVGPQMTPPLVLPCSQQRYKTLHGRNACLMPLRKEEVDILNLVERVQIVRKSWGISDLAQGTRLAIPLIPAQISSQGAQCPVNSIKKAIPRLIRLGLLGFVERDLQGRKLVSARWDARLCGDPGAVWREAEARRQVGMDEPAYWREIGTGSALDPVHNIDLQLAEKIRSYYKETRWK